MMEVIFKKDRESELMIQVHVMSAITKLFEVHYSNGKANDARNLSETYEG